MRVHLPLCLLFTCAPLISAQTLLVANQGDATVSLINPASGKQVAVIAENTPGVHGHEIVASPDGRTAYLPIYGSTGVGKPGIDGHELLILDVPSHSITGHIDFGHSVRPHLPILDPATGMLLVTTELDNSVTVIDPKSHKIVGSIPTGAPQAHMLVLSHDGRRGYTANVGAGSVSVLDIPGRKTIAVIPLSKMVQRISISNDDKLVFTSDQTAPKLDVIDTATNKLKTTVDLPGLGYGTASTHDGRYLIAAIPAEHKVAVVDLASMTVARTVDVATAPQEVLISPDGHTAYVSCNTSGKVAAIDHTNWSVNLITAGPGADGLAWAK